MDTVLSWLPAIGIGYAVMGVICWVFLVIGSKLFKVFWETCDGLRDYLLINLVILLLMLVAWPIVLLENFKENPWSEVP